MSAQLSTSISQIEKDINAAVASQINDILRKNRPNILNDVKSLIPTWIQKQPEIQSLLSSGPDSLIGVFGITSSPTSVVNAIIQSVINTTNIIINPYNASLQNGGMELNIQPEDFANLLGLPQGHVDYNGGNLHWLDWLLTRGDETIVVGYHYNPQTGLGRSGLGNMTSGSSFRVPPQFSGTNKDNFITRAVSGSDAERDITKIFKQVLGA